MPQERALTLPAQASALKPRLGYGSLFALSFGAIIGSGWLVLFGAWLSSAGPGGAVLGFVVGGAAMALIAACYAELTSRIPESGGEFVYALRVFGRPVAFAIGWFMVLYFVCVTVFEALALAWIVKTLAPQTASPELYAVFGQPVTMTAVALGLCGALFFGLLNAGGVSGVARFQSVVTYGFIAVAVLVLGAGAAQGSPVNLQPLFAAPPGGSWLFGAAWIFSNCAFMLNGFQAIPLAIEERSARVTLNGAAVVLVASVLAAVGFYAFVVLCGGAVQPWRETARADLAINAALRSLPHGGLLATVLLLAGAASLLKAWNSMMLMGSRLVMAMGRAGFLPQAFALTHPVRGTPVRAVALVAGLNAVGVLLGRGAITPLIDMCSMVLTLAFLMSCLAVARLRRRGGPAPAFALPGGAAGLGLATLGAAALALVALAAPLRASRLPVEWLLVAGWGAAGLAVWAAYARRGGEGAASPLVAEARP